MPHFTIHGVKLLTKRRWKLLVSSFLGYAFFVDIYRYEFKFFWVDVSTHSNFLGLLITMLSSDKQLIEVLTSSNLRNNYLKIVCEQNFLFFVT